MATLYGRNAAAAMTAELNDLRCFVQLLPIHLIEWCRTCVYKSNSSLLWFRDFKTCLKLRYCNT